jgi:hypothetical protein
MVMEPHRKPDKFSSVRSTTNHSQGQMHSEVISITDYMSHWAYSQSRLYVGDITSGDSLPTIQLIHYKIYQTKYAKLY